MSQQGQRQKRKQQKGPLSIASVEVENPGIPKRWLKSREKLTDVVGLSRKMWPGPGYQDEIRLRELNCYPGPTDKQLRNTYMHASEVSRGNFLE